MTISEEPRLNDTASEAVQTEEQENVPTALVVATPQDGGQETLGQVQDTDVSTDVPELSTQDAVITYLKELLEQEGVPTRQELDRIKLIYYKLHTALAASAKETFVAQGGNPEDFLPPIDQQEETFKQLFHKLKQRRTRIIEDLEQLKKDNLKRKEDIIARIKEISLTADAADKGYDEFKKLQATWHEIKTLPAEKISELWSTYQFCVEQYYDQLKLNHESRAYDFKKNLAAKLKICETAETLQEEKDVLGAFNKLQQLHQEYREIGPVEKDKREEVWQRFKAASTLINKRHLAHFEGIKAQQEENLAAKTALCEQVEAIDLDALTKGAEWDKVTEQVMAIQKAWREVGFTPRKVNSQIYDRFRTACDIIFKRKADFFKEQHAVFAENIKIKQALLEEAEAIKDSTDYTQTANRLMELQKKWKEVGPTAYRQSDAIWKKFHAACNAFFERKAAETADQKQVEVINLEKKRSILEALKTLLEEKPENADEQLRELMAQWREIGFVPFRQKEKIYKAYKQLLDDIFAVLDLKRSTRHMDRFQKDIAQKDGGELNKQRDRLYRAYEAKKNEIKTFETNLNFLTAKSKSGNSLLDGMNRNVEKLKNELDQLRQKIEAIDHKSTEETETAEPDTAPSQG